MTSLAGSLLLASPQLLDPNFFRTVVLLLEHTPEEGAFGVVLNRPSSSGLGEELPGWEPLLAEPEVVFVGGPVQPQVAVGLSGAASGSTASDVRVVDLSASPGNVDAPVRIFAGYAGWSPGQLEAELLEGGWVVAAAEAGDVFSPQPERLWRDVMRRQPGLTALLASFPLDPAMN